jgi:hypothetical protein
MVRWTIPPLDPLAYTTDGPNNFPAFRPASTATNYCYASTNTYVVSRMSLARANTAAEAY